MIRQSEARNRLRLILQTPLNGETAPSQCKLSRLESFPGKYLVTMRMPSESSNNLPDITGLLYQRLVDGLQLR